MFFKNVCFVSLLLLITVSSFAQSPYDHVNGNLIQFNNNGLWCWFQDERAIVNPSTNELILGSDASGSGVGNQARDGKIEAVVLDLGTYQSTRYDLAQMGCDDHNAPGLALRPDGKVIAMYSAHYDYYKNRYRIFNGSSWTSEKGYDWTTRSGGTNYTIAYNNVYYLSAEGRMYDFSRANNRSPNFIISDDLGETWTFGGQLTTNTSNSYNKGYYKYWSNGVDRIDFIFTEQHPRDTLTSIYHGYIQGGKAYKSDGTLVDDDIRDDSFIPAFWDFTLVFANGTTIGNHTFYRCWQSDMIRYEDGTIATIITARDNQFESPGYPDNSINPEHDFIYCRFDGSDWSYTWLAKAGFKFYSSEADYVGLGALCPNDPTTLYISTPYNAADSSEYFGIREIFKGVTEDNGATWSWSPITQNSVRDNMRPIVPLWDDQHTALLWCRGSYLTAQSFDAAVVGLIENDEDLDALQLYTDADLQNTTLATGNTLVPTGPDVNQGAADNQWHLRTGYGNGGSVLTSAEVGGEDAPTLKTRITLPEAGTWDIWVNFWANPSADWRIKAGLSQSSMQIFRQIASQQVTDGSHYQTLELSGSGDVYLYQAYLGRVQADAAGTVDVFVDDEARRVGSNSSLTGNTVRTWYDGVSYACMDHTVGVNALSEAPAKDFNLSQNYPNPFNPTTQIAYTMLQTDRVTLKVFDITGREISTLVNARQNAGTYLVEFNGHDLPSGIYFYQLKVGSTTETHKMSLIR